MRALIIAASAVVALAAGQAEAAGCLKGAAVGGLAGHMAHHGVLGAVGGCVVGHHMAAKAQQQQQQAPQNTQRQ